MKREIRTGLVLVLGGVLLPTAFARASPRKLDLTMVLDGQITVSPTGKVEDYQIREADKVPKPILELIRKTVNQWRFEPARSHGQPVPVKTPMHLRVVATPTDKQHVQLRVSGQWFGSPGADGIHVKSHQPDPDYPLTAIKAGVGGTVYLVAMVSNDGKVAKVAAQQVNLDTLRRPAQMKHWRKVLAQSAILALKQWQFEVPANGGPEHRKHWFVRAPIGYQVLPLGAAATRPYASWSGYVRGPVQPIPWLTPTMRVADIDAIPWQGTFLAKQSMQLSSKPHR
ncbi:hypothetical protein [Oleiagrimonas sp. C23AA]|uniref:hypothetical protein n=1 Tax=Oleiagrimonas sp. C23AA TaxID=2719047 RepID=UPI00142450F6|nr:hypothetical protein [Oleiagrimonas sp. C23AA]NII09545.1 hypothetical protein [Oleiagrimonas sp. C23AA]